MISDAETRLQLSYKCLRLFNLLHVYINLTINLINLTREAITVETTLPFQILCLNQGNHCGLFSVTHFTNSMVHWRYNGEKKYILKFQRNQELSTPSLLMEPFIYLVFLTEKGPLAFSYLLFTNDTAFTYLV